ncbi:MAG: hypothetical protein DRP87_07095 [Spirochaetes bacterium]|nr:MAG: hypothetical protein DRP87_07095 [Spirochaetota bacterium]
MILKRKYIIYILPGLAMVIFLSSCGKNLFAPLTFKPPKNSEVALERAKDLYLSGDIERAEEFYDKVILDCESDPGKKDLYYDALRGKAKCILEHPEGDPNEVLKVFIDFAMSIDMETFDVSKEKLETFSEYSKGFQKTTEEAFETLKKIPRDDREEGDYANLSMFGLFYVSVDLLNLFTAATQEGANIMNRINELEKKIEEFNENWDIYENPQNYDPNINIEEIKEELCAIAKEIENIYDEIISTIETALNLMKDIRNKSDIVLNETKEATNPLSTMLREVFATMFDTIKDVLPNMEEIQTESGTFYDNLQEATKF